jgi:hypothetical protein
MSPKRTSGHRHAWWATVPLVVAEFAKSFGVTGNLSQPGCRSPKGGVLRVGREGPKVLTKLLR